MMQANIEEVISYHEQTKHQLDRYARSLGYLDWANQPAPFRNYIDAPTIKLEHPDETDSPPYDHLFESESIPPRPLDKASLSRLFYDSLALSAWKQTPGSQPWALRVNPSSGNLHPTEAYLIGGPLAGISEQPAIYHYSPLRHALEKRISLTQEEWNKLAGEQSAKTIFLALTSIYWREAWKYGERAFRYCNHDVGHALGTVALAAASLGWHSNMVESVSDEEIRRLLSLGDEDSRESEHPECLLRLSPNTGRTDTRVTQELIRRLSTCKYLGHPNQLSQSHQPWPAIERVSEFSEYPGHRQEMGPANRASRTRQDKPGSSAQSARLLFRNRRSAVAMDSSVSISRQEFFQMLSRLVPIQPSSPFDLLSWSPLVSLVLFSHRVRDLNQGVYLLVRSPEHLKSLQECLREDFFWQKPEGVPEELDLYRLAEGDCRDSAKIISCHQGIAADGAFSLGMLARFEPVLRERGAWYYRRLHWECGLIGQLLYLEAEAAGISGTGIGCFHDDVLHQFLGIEDLSWQTLYHFTVGGALEDFRLQTIPAYRHLETSQT